MNYEQTIQYLYSQLPMFQRIGAEAFKKDLTNTLILCGHLGNPQNKFRTVHVAGTNGKGSTAHAIASVLQSAGYKTGLYTSPHLKDFTERIRIDGIPIYKTAVVEFVEKNRKIIEDISPSFFEVTVAMAFDYFAKENIDIAVIEVGMGGRLDSTNVIRPELSVITNISFDHQDFLGDTLPKIAKEKAGIIKEGIPFVISTYQQSVADVFMQTSHMLQAPVSFADQEYTVVLREHENKKSNIPSIGLLTKLEVDIIDNQGNMVFENLQFGLSGAYQVKNIPGIIKALQILKEKGFQIEGQHIRAGFSEIVGKTGLKGRWNVLRTAPLCICDTGHNEDGIKHIVQQIKSIPYNQLHFVLGVVKDKKLDGVLSLLPKDANYYFTQAQIPRALSAEELQHKASGFGLKGKQFLSVNEAFQNALLEAQPDDLVFIGGSTFVVAELEEL